jgi:hypothetical protein
MEQLTAVARRPLGSPHFDTNGDCRQCAWHISFHTFQQGDVICVESSDAEKVAQAIDTFGSAKFNITQLLAVLNGTVSRDMVDQTLSRMVKAKELRRHARGVYWKAEW